ncbi:hypothetical protein P7K49_010206 [Saguinus oedipus]|uniref:Uncharacterized protein n=1 Tax=Saguinus oedipus TaxID=9490 RepID=A0ABQ9VN10_SAGOE|nr:hypothetical protein P7K49_010206 [Saguinus oedipus]
MASALEQFVNSVRQLSAQGSSAAGCRQPTRTSRSSPAGLPSLGPPGAPPPPGPGPFHRALCLTVWGRDFRQTPSRVTIGRWKPAGGESVLGAFAQRLVLAGYSAARRRTLRNPIVV